MGSANNKDSLVLSRIEKKLRDSETQPIITPPHARRAGVALILRSFGGELNILFIRRALREDDPWSGHIAFPGGHHERSDTDLMSTVIRETYEEVGVVLSRSECVCQLPFEKPYTSDQRSDLVVLPYVFVLTHDPNVQLNHEVSEVIWAPLEQLVSGELLTHETVHFNENEYRLPGFRLKKKHFVWGLTFRVLHRFFTIIN